MSAALAHSGEVVIDASGVYDLPAEVYHRDPVPGGSLSSTGARKLLSPSCPALFRHWQLHGEPYKRQFEFGHAAHAQVLGVGAPIEVVDAKDWRTKKSQDALKKARAAGKTPLLSHEWNQVQDMAKALRRHPVASVLFQPGTGRVEQSLFWFDEEFEVWRRAMLDLFRDDGNGLFLVVDYKSADSVDPGYLSRALFNYGYHQQGAWYLDAVEAAGLSPHQKPVFLLVFQQKTPPYLIRVAQPDPEAIQWGRVLNRKALGTYRRCIDTGDWPGYGDDVLSLSLPVWDQRRLEAAWERGDLDPSTPLAEALS